MQRPSAVLVRLALALPLDGALLDDVGRMVASEAGGLKLLDAPGCAISPGASAEIYYLRGRLDTHRPFSLSNLSPMHFESLRNSRFDLALSVSTIRFWRCHRRQLKFSRRCPCSRKLATLVQTWVGVRGTRPNL